MRPLGSEVESTKAGLGIIPIPNEEPISKPQLPLPPLLASMPHSLLQHHQASLHLSTSHAADAHTAPNASTTTFDLLQFPALKKFIDVQSSQQKPAAAHLSAFSSIKSQRGNYKFVRFLGGIYLMKNLGYPF